MGCQGSKGSVAPPVPRPSPAAASAPRSAPVSVAPPAGAGNARSSSSSSALFWNGDEAEAEADEAAVQFYQAECGVCYEELYKDVVSVMVDAQNERVCRHFVHEKCCATLENSEFGKKCPICQEPFERTRTLPDPSSDPAGWFSVVDMNGRSQLARWQVVDALCATVNIDGVRLQENFDTLWQQWDREGNNVITMDEFRDPRRGLLKWVKENMPILRRKSMMPVPDIRTHREGWFQYWDSPANGGDGTNQLTKEETARALMKTFRSEDTLFMRNLVCALWDDFDVDKSGTIKPYEFLRPNIGLLDTILANIKSLDGIVANASAECGLCYQDLCTGPVAGLVNFKHRRVCRHYFHSGCLKRNLESAAQWACPTCKIRFSAVLDLPDPLKSPEEWFRAVDVDGTKQLTRWEVVDALIATMPIDVQKLDEELGSHWESWDKTSSNTVTLPEFLDPDGGLLAWIKGHMSSMRRLRPAPVPDIKSHRDEWFRYWDDPANGGDGTGQLTRSETVRALMKTFRTNDVDAVRGLVHALWDDFDSDKSGTVKPHEFLRPQIGLLDTVLANMPR